MLCCYTLCRIIFLSDSIFFLLLYILLGFSLFKTCIIVKALKIYIYKTGMYGIIRNKGVV